MKEKEKHFMRKVTVFVSFLVFALIAVGAKAQTYPTFFPSREQCQSALASGNFNPYTPKFFGLKGNNPVNGTSTKVVPIEANACVRMLTTNDKQWVVQLDGTKFRWKVNEDGSLDEVYALDVCGNPVYEIAYVQPPPKPVPVVPVVSTPPPAIVDVCLNILGAQDTVPTGMVRDVAGNCVVPVLVARTHHKNHRVRNRNLAIGAFATGAGLVIRNNWCYLWRLFH
jgi:hypothetical protein